MIITIDFFVADLNYFGTFVENVFFQLKRIRGFVSDTFNYIFICCSFICEIFFFFTKLILPNLFFEHSI